MRIIFFGSSKFSIKALEACLDSSHEICFVITTPPQKKGRGLKFQPSVVWEYANELNLPLKTYSNLKDSETVKEIESLKPDLFIVSSYGKFLPSEILRIPKYRFNVHPSLIPKYRGASPINAAILNADTETGISILDITSKLDAGDLYYQKRFSIASEMTAVELSDFLSQKSHEALLEVFEKLEKGKLVGIVQDDSKATFASALKKEDGLISFSEPALKLDCMVRGLQPWPGSFFMFQGQRIQVLNAAVLRADTDKPAGTLLSINEDESISISTSKNIIKILKVKPSGKNIMSAKAFVNGRRMDTGCQIKN